MKTRISKFVSCISIVVILASQVACTKEKAEALRTAANSFRAQADTALSKLEDLSAADVAFGPVSDEAEIARTIEELRTEDVTFANVEAAVMGSKLQEFDRNDYQKKLTSIRATYEEFAAIFETLPRGSFFAGDAVARSEELAIKLTIQMNALAWYIKSHPFRLNPRLIEVRGRWEEARTATPEAVKELKLRAVAEEIRKIRVDTDAANNAAIAECAKGAVIGIEVAKLIRNYKRLSVNDILQIVKTALPMVSQLTGKNTEALFGKLSNVQAAIDSDPAWKALAERLEMEINRVPPAERMP